MTNRKFVFTISNYDEDNVNYLKDLPNIQEKVIVLAFGKEVAPTTGTPHLQGYIRVKDPMRFTGVQALLVNNGKVAWTDVARATEQSNILYTQKGSQSHEEWEDKHETGENFGKDADSFVFNRKEKKKSTYELCMENIIDGDDLMTITRKYPELMFKHRQNIKAIIDSVKNDNEKLKLMELSKFITLKEWQQEIYDYCLDIPSLTSDKARKVTWIYDDVGKNGKTVLADKLVLCRGAVKFTNAASKDIICAYNGEPIILFDLERTQEDKINYQVMESVLDPILFSPKYTSEIKYRASGAILLVFANFLPKLNALSMDRWRILKLDDNKIIEVSLSEVNNLRIPINGRGIEFTSHGCFIDLHYKG